MSELPKLFRDIQATLEANLNMLKRVEARLAIPTAVAQEEGLTLPLPTIVENVQESRDWYLPKSDDWDIVLHGKYPVTLQPKERMTVVDRVARGWLMGWIFVTNNPLCGYEINIETKTSKLRYKNTPETLYTASIVDSPNNILEWLSRYDPVTPIYVIALTPSPWVPFRGRQVATYDNTESATASIIYQFIMTTLDVYGG